MVVYRAVSPALRVVYSGRAYGVDVHEAEFGDEQIHKVEARFSIISCVKFENLNGYVRIFVDLGSEASWGQCPSTKVRELCHKFAKHQVHQRQHRASSNGSNDADEIQGPACLVCVPENAL